MKKTTEKSALTRLLCFTVLAVLSACATAPPAPRDLLDEHSGVTVSVVSRPIEFKRESTAASAHDFLTLVAVQRDEQGQYTALLLLYDWSVFYDPFHAAAEAGGGELQIDADGRAIDLKPLPQLPTGLPGPKDLYVPDTKVPALRAYATDLDTLRRIATSRDLSVTLPQKAAGGSFGLFTDGRPALQEFVKHLSGS